MASMHMRDAHGTTLVIVSHDREWLDSVTDTMVMLRNGQLAG
jgi:ATPase subunit of ABC transporter with duplicated ATPase domains